MARKIKSAVPFLDHVIETLDLSENAEAMQLLDVLKQRCGATEEVAAAMSGVLSLQSELDEAKARVNELRNQLKQRFEEAKGLAERAADMGDLVTMSNKSAEYQKAKAALTEPAQALLSTGVTKAEWPKKLAAAFPQDIIAANEVAQKHRDVSGLSEDRLDSLMRAGADAEVSGEIGPVEVDTPKSRRRKRQDDAVAAGAE